MFRLLRDRSIGGARDPSTTGTPYRFVRRFDHPHNDRRINEEMLTEVLVWPNSQLCQRQARFL
jgi:hypothetical protein